MTEAEELREATREAHAAIKDLKAAVKEAQQVTRELNAEAHMVFDERINAEVKAGLEKYAASIEASIESATEAVYERFKQVTDILTGEDKKNRRRGPTLTDMARIVDAERREVR